MLSKPVTVHGYTEEQLMGMKPDDLRAIFHERTHHTVEVLIYRILNGTRKMPEDFGEVAEYLLGLWKKRGLPLDPPDIRWCILYIDLATRMRKGEKVKLEPTPRA